MARLFSLISDYRLQGAFILSGLLALIWFSMFEPVFIHLSQLNRQSDQLALLIERHKTELSMPPPNEENEQLSAYLLSLPQPDRDVRLRAIQTEMASAIQRNGARLVEQRSMPDNTSIDGLIAYRFRFQYEGDLQNIMDVFSDLRGLQVPIFVEQLTIASMPGGYRRDSRLRVTLVFRIWVNASGETQ